MIVHPVIFVIICVQLHLYKPKTARVFHAILGQVKLGFHGYLPEETESCVGKPCVNAAITDNCFVTEWWQQRIIFFVGLSFVCL